MQPFLATYQPARSDDCRFVDAFGGLPTDVAKIVVRSIPQCERTSLLSLALLETKNECIGSDNEVATWRLFIRVMANQSNSNTLPRYQSSEALALDHVAELLKRQNTMTHEAWVEIMATTVEQLGHSARLHAAVRDALSHAAAIAPAPRARLLRRIVETSRFAQPGQQSGVMLYVLPVAKDLPSRERCDLFLPLLSLCMKAHAQNGEAGEWLRKTTALLARLPEPLAMHAIEEALMHVAKDCADMKTYIAVVEALWGQATTLSAQPQAHLLLQLALCIGQIDGEPGGRMLSALLTQADALDLPQANKTAWKLLYRAAAWHHDMGMQRNQQHRSAIVREARVLPESLRRQVISMLQAIDEAPYARKYRLPDAGWGCTIL
ncbi:hypothetical protein [Noviherbaspirillum pedocola]|uniref:Uncharacterized protein n=1 Tax=Noviherbaspirillum pedocola TaxID=2801341 RepID=A0A934SYG8_9BURK|nr:hypothetical protein [Noviherbaspirillum pedocola]MBK4738870.1 hypothetical protein [Noviherbaspirillum pedocola]